MNLSLLSRCVSARVRRTRLNSNVVRPLARGCKSARN
jgi:hypothetical protein